MRKRKRKRERERESATDRARESFIRKVSRSHLLSSSSASGSCYNSSFLCLAMRRLQRPRTSAQETPEVNKALNEAH